MNGGGAARARGARSGASAGFGRRVAALSYDCIVLSAPLIFFTWAAVLVAHGKAMLPDTVGKWAYLYHAGLAAIIAAYFILNWVHSGQTVGMRAWRLHAVDANGKRLTLKAASMRFVCALLAWAPAALGVLWLYADADRLALHDRLSNTRVVHLPGA